MKYAIAKNCVINDKPYADGDVIDEADIPAGSMASVRGLGLLGDAINEPVEVPTEAATAEPTDDSPAEPPLKKGKK